MVAHPRPHFITPHHAGCLPLLPRARASSSRGHSPRSGYVGHYILITGYDESRRGYYIKDPAKSPDADFVPSEAVDRARRSHGTDEDLVIIPWEQPFRRKVPADSLLSDASPAA